MKRDIKRIGHIKATQHRKKKTNKQLQFSVPASDNLNVYVCLSTCVSDMVQGESKGQIGLILGSFWQNIPPRVF